MGEIAEPILAPAFVRRLPDYGGHVAKARRATRNNLPIAFVALLLCHE